ncbi:MAG: VirB4 family type IV secretion/conjugal transfer ATPase, partial [Rickettsiaceae bacterium]|nr:VirB4 family type IV secretion/conjugal transfer ATPase [Rickettsiaceae bacterium]
TNTITNFAENFLKSASNKLTKLTDNILESLNEFGATKLGIKFVDDQCFSEPMFLYRRIIQLNENECLLPITDISKALASHNYAVGSDKIEVIGDGQKRFAAILSIKEYQEVASDPIDLFLQIPVEMITTEVFYFVNRKEIAPIFKDQDYILKVSKNDELREFKELDKILDDKEEIKNKFCQQQISVMVIADDVEHLDQQIIKASQKLASIGIVHVREDINLEKTFWAQLPANFSYLSRMQPTIIDNVAALASLHNSPTGNQYNPWGKAITLLRTEKGTPYFMNFHDSNGETNNCIIGTKKSGKTTLLNFLISEADKFNPSIFYVSDDLSSGLFIKAKGGKWLQDSKQIINPLLIQNSDKAQGFLVEFFKIIGNHYIKPINETGLTELTNLASDVLKLEPDKRKLSQIISNIQDPDLKKRFTVYDKDQKYYQIFESDTNFNLEDGSITGVSLREFNDAAFTKKHYPREKKLLDQFEYELNTMRSVKAAIVFCLHYLFNDSTSNRKIFTIDNLHHLLNLKYFSGLITPMYQDLKENDGIFITTVDIENLQKLYEEEDQVQKQQWLTEVKTNFIIPPDAKVPNIANILNLTEEEAKKLTKLNALARTFLIKQDDKAISSELSIGGLRGLTRILSSTKVERDIYVEIVKKHGDKDPKDWVGALYEEFEML